MVGLVNFPVRADLVRPAEMVLPRSLLSFSAVLSLLVPMAGRMKSLPAVNLHWQLTSNLCHRWPDDKRKLLQLQKKPKRHSQNLFAEFQKDQHQQCHLTQK